jgi:hypothetical protein
MTAQLTHIEFLKTILAAAAMLLVVGCSPPESRRVERIQFSPVELDLDSLRINQKATMAFVTIEAAIVDERSLDRLFGRPQRTCFPRSRMAGEVMHDIDVYLVAVVHIDPAFRDQIRYIDAAITEPKELNGGRIRFLGGALEDLARSDVVYSVTRLDRLSLSFDHNHYDRRIELREMPKTRNIKLRVLDVFKK